MHPSRKELRKFGLSVGMAFSLLGTLSWYRGHHIPPLVLWALGVPLILGGALLPDVLAPVQRAWFRFAAIVGHFNMRVILSVFYFLIVTPLSLVMRLFRDPLDRKFEKDRETYWAPRERGQADAGGYEKQF